MAKGIDLVASCKRLPPKRGNWLGALPPDVQAALQRLLEAYSRKELAAGPCMIYAQVKADLAAAGVELGITRSSFAEWLKRGLDEESTR